MAAAIRRIAVITGDPTLPDPTKREFSYHEEDKLTHDAMKAAFRKLSAYEFSFFDDHKSLLERLRLDPPDFIVNFCDTGYCNNPIHEPSLAAYYDLLGIPYTGAPPSAMVIVYDKAIVRLVAQSLGIAVPEEHYIPADMPFDQVPDLLPALFKPNTADGSVGITKDAVVRSRAEARRYFEWLRDTLPGRDVLLQEYLPGAEYGVGLIGNPDSGFTVLPPLVVDYSRLPAGLNPILSFESKAMPDSPYWTDIEYRRADLAPEAVARLTDWTERLYARLGLRDYGRFDFRAAADGEIKLMEVNSNPAWANDAKLAMMAGFAGMEYHEMLNMILDVAIARSKRERGESH
ncbi:MAG TPA: hypothetical protein VKN76_10200 [Kiloniellaceae bacterium]|nr:hypothetical protein [Kiloniellaceae bacterium]